MNQQLLEKLRKTEKIAVAGRIGRLLNNPAKYVAAMWQLHVAYPKTKQEKVVRSATFFGTEMNLALPAATDIYVTGGKSHPSEIRLAKYLIHHLKPGDHFLDIGAHFGYFSLLAATLVSGRGKVVAYEPSRKTFAILQENARGLPQITVHQKAISDSRESLVFYEFPVSHSEYNSSSVAQFEAEPWFKDVKPEQVEIAATTLDTITLPRDFLPQIVKIDVEGAEHRVMLGGLSYLSAEAPSIVMEYLAPSRNNESHREAAKILSEIGFKPFAISHEGLPEPLADIENYLTHSGLDSENIVFQK